MSLVGTDYFQTDLLSGLLSTLPSGFAADLLSDLLTPISIMPSLY
jgi:hypothetical protein